MVAASATIGRPLRRELYRVLLSGDVGSGGEKRYGELPLIRADDEFLMPARRVDTGQEEEEEEEEVQEEEEDSGAGYSLEDLESAVEASQGAVSEAPAKIKSVHQVRDLVLRRFFL